MCLTKLCRGSGPPASHIASLEVSWQRPPWTSRLSIRPQTGCGVPSTAQQAGKADAPSRLTSAGALALLGGGCPGPPVPPALAGQTRSARRWAPQQHLPRQRAQAALHEEAMKPEPKEVHLQDLTGNDQQGRRFEVPGALPSQVSIHCGMKWSCSREGSGLLCSGRHNGCFWNSQLPLPLLSGHHPDH